jgi:putative addiction module killer protein
MAKATQPKTIVVYADEDGEEPYTQWLESLKDEKTKERIRLRVRRLENGLYGDCAPVGEGVSELRLFFGAGFRVFFGEEDGNIVILLCGGDKSTQQRDIKAAKKYWQEHKNHG